MARFFPLIVSVLGATVLLPACDASSSEVADGSPTVAAADAAEPEPQEAVPVKIAMTVPVSGQVMPAAKEAGGAGGCTPVQFKRGTSSVTVTGSVPPEDPRAGSPQPACYTLTVGEGQQAKVTLLSGENVGITIPGVGNMRDSFEFTTRRGTYKLELYQLFPNPQAAPFRMHIEVSSFPSSAQSGAVSSGQRAAGGPSAAVRPTLARPRRGSLSPTSASIIV